MSARILVVDNYDSFVFNLVQYLYQLGAECEVLRNDEVSTSHAQDGFDGVLPVARPRDAGAGGRVRGHGPALRGHRGAGLRGCASACSRCRWRTAVWSTGRPSCCTARPRWSSTRARASSRACPSPFTATRYHSLAAEPATVPAELEVTARTHDGIIMGLRHRELPVEGVQFHPESVLTEHGHRMLANWLAECGDQGAVARSAGLAPVVGRATA